MGVAGEPAAADLATEVVEVALVEATLEEGPGVDAGDGVALDVDLVAGHAVGLAPEEVVEADLVERRRRGEGGEVPADAVGPGVGVDDHDRRVPADEGADAALDVDVAGEPALLVGGDGVDVGRRHLGRGADLALTGPLGELRHQEAGPDLAPGVDDRVERVEPLLGLERIGVGQLVDVAVDGHWGNLFEAGVHADRARAPNTGARIVSSHDAGPALVTVG